MKWASKYWQRTKAWNIWAKESLSTNKRHWKSKSRIRAAWTTFHKYRQELTSKKYMLKLRLRLFDARVSPTLCYAAGTWTPSREHERMIQSTQRKMLRLIIQTKRKYKKIEKQVIEHKDEERTADQTENCSTDDESGDGQSTKSEDDVDSGVTFDEDSEKDIDARFFTNGRWIWYHLGCNSCRFLCVLWTIPSLRTDLESLTNFPAIDGMHYDNLRKQLDFRELLRSWEILAKLWALAFQRGTLFMWTYYCLFKPPCHESYFVGSIQSLFWCPNVLIELVAIAVYPLHHIKLVQIENFIHFRTVECILIIRQCWNLRSVVTTCDWQHCVHHYCPLTFGDTVFSLSGPQLTCKLTECRGIWIDVCLAAQESVEVFLCVWGKLPPGADVLLTARHHQRCHERFGFGVVGIVGMSMNLGKGPASMGSSCASLHKRGRDSDVVKIVKRIAFKACCASFFFGSKRTRKITVKCSPLSVSRSNQGKIPCSGDSRTAKSTFKQFVSCCWTVHEICLVFLQSATGFAVTSAEDFLDCRAGWSCYQLCEFGFRETRNNLGDSCISKNHFSLVFMKIWISMKSSSTFLHGVAKSQRIASVLWSSSTGFTAVKNTSCLSFWDFPPRCNRWSHLTTIHDLTILNVHELLERTRICEENSKSSNIDTWSLNLLLRPDKLSSVPWYRQIIIFWMSSGIPQRCEPWEYFPLDFHLSSINSIQIFDDNNFPNTI